MPIPAAQRIQRELAELQRADVGIQCRPASDTSPDLFHLIGTIHGSDGTPYAGGVFDIDIKLQGYPLSVSFTSLLNRLLMIDGLIWLQPPQMKFTTKVYHPNISSQTGAICLDILKTKWYT